MSKKQADLFAGTKHDRPKPSRRHMAHVIDAGVDMIRFGCMRCGWDSDWVDYDMAESDAKKGIPCKVCNQSESVPIQTWCEHCGTKHLDNGDWGCRPHKTHQCQVCGHEWRPFPFSTVGVYNDTWFRWTPELLEAASNDHDPQPIATEAMNK